MSFSLYFSNTGLVWFWKVSHLMPNCGWSYGICPVDLAPFDYAFSLGPAFYLFKMASFVSSKFPLARSRSSMTSSKNIMLSENCWQKDWCSRTNLLRGEVDYFAWPHYQRLKCLSLEIINLENLHLWFKIKDEDFPKMKMALHYQLDAQPSVTFSSDELICVIAKIRAFCTSWQLYIFSIMEG